ncbi:MAG: lamin tail domain-containing protein, partial [Verrucomicrobiota bacterium]
LTAANLPVGASFTPVTNATSATGTFTWASAAPTGNYSVTFIATDNDGVSSQVVAISVFPPTIARINEVRSDDSGSDNIEFVEIIALAGTDLLGATLTHYNGSASIDGGLWSYTFTNSFVVPDDGITDNMGRALGFVVFDEFGTVPNSDFRFPGTSLQQGPDGLVLFDAIGNVIDAMAWEGAGDMTDDDPGTVTTTGPTSADNYLHITADDDSTDNSLQAPNGVSDDDGTGWSITNATPGAINLGQVSGSIVLEGMSPIPSNQPPVVLPVGPQSVLSGSPLNFSVVAEDLIDGDLVTLSASNLPPGAVFAPVMNNSSVTGQFMWASSVGPATYTSTFVAVDADGTNTRDVVITVSNIFFAGEIMVSEILHDPDPLADFFAEWFELYNSGTMGVDINGWTIQGDFGTTHVISNGAPLIVPPLGFLVLGGEANMAVNGGVPVDYSYGLAGVILDNGPGNLVILDDLSNEVTRVDYDNGVTFPPTTPGVSMYLLDPELDDNVGTNWTLSTSDVLWPTGTAGQFGSPGASNEMGRWGVPLIPMNEPPVLDPIGDKGVFLSNSLS